MSNETQRQLKRAACLLAAQLPDDPEEAMIVLTIAMDLVRHLAADPGQIATMPCGLPARKGLAIVQEDGRVVPAGSRGIASPG